MCASCGKHDHNPAKHKALKKRADGSYTKGKGHEHKTYAHIARELGMKKGK